MNDNEKDLFEENNLADGEAQKIERVQPIDEDVSMNAGSKNTEENNVEAVKSELPEDAPVDTSAAAAPEEKSEKIQVKEKKEPSKDVLFGGYEVKNWDFTPRIYKILAGATVFNLLALLVIGQTNMLATSACESPFVNRVCQVLDTVSVAKRLYDSSAGDEWGKEDFELAQLDQDKVVWVDTTNIEPQISYPEGYFQVANRDEIEQRRLQEEMLNNPDLITNGTPPSTYNPPFKPTPNPPRASGGSSSGSRSFGGGRSTIRRKGSGGDNLLSKKPKLPESRKNPVKGKVDEELFQFEDENPKDKEQTANKDPKNTKQPINDKNPVTKNTADKSDSVDGVKINKLPMELFVKNIIQNREVNEVILKKPFAVKYKAQLNEDGTYKNIRLVGRNADDEIFGIINNGVLTLGASKFLKYLTDLDVKDVDISIKQDDNKFQALIVSSQPTPESAKTMASGLNGLISLGKYAKKSEINGGEKDPIKLQGEKDELYLLTNTKVTSQDKNFILTIDLDRSEYQEMVKRRLDQEAKKIQEDPTYGKPDKPNGSANTAKKEDKKAE